MAGLSKIDVGNMQSECDGEDAKFGKQVRISKDFNGLVNYFSAKNIRNKIRHPIFLTLQFPLCVKIFYNPSLVTSSDQADIAVEMHSDSMKLTEVKKKYGMPAYIRKDTKYICLVNIS